MLANGFLISWAMPAESWPMEVSRSIRRINSSVLLPSVRSRTMKITPIRLS